jgi:hypothetical protein
VVHHLDDSIGARLGDAPGTFRRPADAPSALPRSADSAAAHSLHQVLASRGVRPSTLGGRLRRLLSKVSGREDRRLLGALVAVTNDLVTQCDLLSERLAVHESLTADVTATYGEELTRLRAEVLHLSRAVTPPNRP